MRANCWSVSDPSSRTDRGTFATLEKVEQGVLWTMLRKRRTKHLHREAFGVDLVGPKGHSPIAAGRRCTLHRTESAERGGRRTCSIICCERRIFCASGRYNPASISSCRNETVISDRHPHNVKVSWRDGRINREPWRENQGYWRDDGPI